METYYPTSVGGDFPHSSINDGFKLSSRRISKFKNIHQNKMVSILVTPKDRSLRAFTVYVGQKVKSSDLDTYVKAVIHNDQNSNRRWAINQLTHRPSQPWAQVDPYLAVYLSQHGLNPYHDPERNISELHQQGSRHDTARERQGSLPPPRDLPGNDMRTGALAALKEPSRSLYRNEGSSTLPDAEPKWLRTHYGHIDARTDPADIVPMLEGKENRTATHHAAEPGRYAREPSLYRESSTRERSAAGARPERGRA